MNVYMYEHMCGGEKERDRIVQKPLNLISKLMVCILLFTKYHPQTHELNCRFLAAGGSGN